ncbi:MAG TPA: hypothetical protein DDW50_07720 [Firmicutes bacterium]|nr:hypothetical protein [Bacillota bacterium]
MFTLEDDGPKGRVSTIVDKISNLDEFRPSGHDLSAKVAQLEAEIQELKAQQVELMAARNVIIEKLYVRRVDVKELQFKLDKIAVDDLSGMLNVGVNSDGKMKKREK